MLTIGLTGGIASGKTTVSDLLLEKGLTVIDADVIARDLTGPHTAAAYAIIEHFGQEYTLAPGIIDRKLLREKIFYDLHAKQYLEQLLHPIIHEKISYLLANAKKRGQSLTILSSPILLETQQQALVDRILIVHAPTNLQIKRAMKRDNCEASTIEAIIRNQTSRELRLALADDIIYNAGNFDDLQLQVEKVYHLYLSLCQNHD